MDFKKVAERIRELRHESGLSAVKLGKEVGLSDGAIINWENGKRVPTIEVIYKLSKFFNVTSDYLLGLKDD